jgi:thiol-disulfide isomerase/thioredoxin
MHRDPYTSVKLLVEPGNSYSIAMDVAKKNTQISGANEKGQMLYATSPNSEFVETEAQKLKLLQDSSLVSVHNKVEELKQSDISKFKALLDSGDISRSFFDCIEADRDCYYASLDAIVSLIKMTLARKTKQFVLPTGENLLDNLTKIYSQYPLNDEKLRISPFWSRYAECYIGFTLYDKDDFDEQKINELHTQQVFHTFFINESKKYLTGKAFEFFCATYMYFNSIQHNYEKELISLFEQFTKDYPDSEYSKYLKPEIDEIVKYYQIIEGQFDETMRFMENYENINTLEEALKPLKGKKVYIDIWATWCGPCKAEFKHQKALKKILDEQNIQQLYISIDKDERDQQWKNGIKFYGLSGTHIRANKELAMDLYKRYDKNAKSPYVEIPWYILVDENGNIIDEHAKKPLEIIVNGF